MTGDQPLPDSPSDRQKLAAEALTMAAAFPTTDPELVANAETQIRVVTHQRPAAATRNTPVFISVFVIHLGAKYQLAITRPPTEHLHAPQFALQRISTTNDVRPIQIPFDYRDPEHTVSTTIQFMQDIARLDFLRLPRLPPPSALVLTPDPR